jgi:ribokinase
MKPIVNLGIFVADCSFRTPRLPRIGETLLGQSFALGPGGKGSNQSVASAMAGARVHFITRLGDDDFARMAEGIWAKAGVIPDITVDHDSFTGAAAILIEDGSGNNGIIVTPGAASRITADDVEARRALIEGASVFITQLEQPVPAALRGLQIARAAGVTTILNPAPAADLPDEIFPLCDYITPNETEAELLTGIPVPDLAGAEAAAAALLARGVGAVVMTLGANGALYRDATRSLHVPVISAGKVVETTGAGDAFNGGFAVALAEGRGPLEAIRFGAATAGISVTRPGTAASMPTRAEIDALLAAQAGG